MPSSRTTIGTWYLTIDWSFSAAFFFYQVGFSNESDQKTISFHVPVFLLQAEPLAEDPAPEVLQGAAMCTSGLFLPGHLKNGNLQQNVLTTIFVRNIPT